MEVHWNLTRGEGGKAKIIGPPELAYEVDNEKLDFSEKTARLISKQWKVVQKEKGGRSNRGAKAVGAWNVRREEGVAKSWTKGDRSLKLGVVREKEQPI